MKKNINNNERNIEDVKKPSELIKIYKEQPEPIFNWGGIEDVSFGYIFGPSKVGKTIFSENLAMNLAIGKKSFFNEDMIGTPKKVFMAAMEEDYRNRTRRMISQIRKFDNNELNLLDKYYVLAGKDFPRFLHTNDDWLNFEKQILQINPQIVIIDSFTRILNCDITNREECKKVSGRLRNFAYDNDLCLIIIHHATKMSGKHMTMDNMAGSSVLSQEADFSIGMNRNELTNTRYLKEVFYRYKPSDNLVTRYEIDDFNWIQPGEKANESSLVIENLEEYSSNYDKIVRFLEKTGLEKLDEDESIKSFKIKTAELKKEFVHTNKIKERTLEYTLKKITKDKLLVQDGSQGNYVYDLTHLRNLRNINNDDCEN
uniref:AAA family ATPase n=1 Tax=uncultured Polaribacter sp. TaxID=174711 RepID=UPI002603B0DA|nr:AAA family ATPase [uncultured Polaribacter sp.]